jgi:hypothetical protein
MPDEIDLLRLFRGDAPGPDDVAWERARSAIRLAERPVATGQREDRRPGGWQDRWAGRWPGRLWRLPRHRLGVASGAVLAAGIAAGVVAGLLEGAPSLGGPLVTAWQPARALQSATASVRAPAGSWRLVSYLVPHGWQESTSGPEPGDLTCPTAQTCYVEGDNASSPSGPANMNTLYVSADGARTWSVLPVPAGITFTSPLACATRDDCAAGGLYYGHQPVYLTTTTGGHAWTVSPLPTGDGQIVQLACATATSCRGLTRTSSRVLFPGFDWVRPGIEFIATADGGRHFAVTPFPAGTSMQALSCPTSAHCVAYGLFTAPDPHDKTGPDLTKGVVLVTDDGGTSWRPGTMPANVGAGAFPAITCTDASHCAMLGYVIGPGPQGGTMSVDANGNITETVPDQYSVAGFSTDGGLTWTARRLPASIPSPNLDALACPTASLCYAAGSAAIPQRIGNTFNGGSSVVAVTRDAGRTWQKVSFAVPAKVPGGMQGDSFMDIGQIQCPQADACVAMGVSDQGSKSTPVYTNHG